MSGSSKLPKGFFLPKTAVEILPDRKGKNFSANNLGQRKKNDDYSTPISMVEQLLQVETSFFIRKERTLEPAAGEGVLAKVLKDQGFKAITSYDLNQGQFRRDFLKETRMFPQVITNPPFKLALAFIKKAKLISRRFAFLLPLSYLHGQERYEEVYQDQEFPLRRVHVFTRYPMLGDPVWPDGKYRTGMIALAWFVWGERKAKESTIRPEIRFLDSSRNILTAREFRDRI